MIVLKALSAGFDLCKKPAIFGKVVLAMYYMRNCTNSFAFDFPLVHSSGELLSSASGRDLFLLAKSATSGVIRFR